MTRRILFFLALTTLVGVSRLNAQQISLDTLHRYGLYDTDRLPPSFHAGRRAAVRSELGANSVLFMQSAPERIRGNDVQYQYHQDANFYYLTGHLESHAALLLFASPHTMSDGGQTQEILFVQRRDPSQETWTGKRLGPDGAEDVLGFKYALPIDSLQPYLKLVIKSSDTLYYHPYEREIFQPLINSTIAAWDNEQIAVHQINPRLAIENPAHMLAELRMIKTPEELALLRKAISISNEAHNEILRNVHPGMYEYQIQALGEYVFAKNGAEYVGYPSIVGSGENSTILHYETNRRKTVAGDMIEMDMGAEYHGYTADVTRSYPVDGKFTPEQAAIYDLVYEAQQAGIAAARAGNGFRATHQAAMRVIQAGLLKLGVIQDSNDVKTYFMHGTSHYLGLEVHDAGTYQPFKPNEVITVEPGIYIAAGSKCDPKWWNIGCRIEDDILITDGEPEILSKGSPRIRKDVEAMMHSGSHKIQY